MTDTKKAVQIMSDGDANALVKTWMQSCYRDNTLKKYCINTRDARRQGHSYYPGNCSHINRNLAKDLKNLNNKHKNYNYDSKLLFDFEGEYAQGAAFFLLDQNYHLIKVTDASKLIINVLDPFLSHNLFKNSFINYVSGVELDGAIVNALPYVLTVYGTGNGHLWFSLSRIRKLDIELGKTIKTSKLLITKDCLKLLGINYMFLQTGIVKAFGVHNNEPDFKNGLHLCCDDALDFVHLKNSRSVNLISHFKGLEMLDYVYRSTALFYARDLPLACGLRSYGNNQYADYNGIKVAKAITYTYLLKNKNLHNFEDLVINKWKKLEYLHNQIDFTELSVPELGQLSALPTKLTVDESVRVAKWYIENRNNNQLLNEPGSWGDIYCYYLKAKYNAPAFNKDYSKHQYHFNGFFSNTEVYFLLRYYKKISGRNLEVHAKSLPSFLRFLRSFNLKMYSLGNSDSYLERFQLSSHWNKLYEFCAGRYYADIWDSMCKIDYYNDMVYECLAGYNAAGIKRDCDKQMYVDVFYNNCHYTVLVKYDAIKNCYLVDDIFEVADLPISKQVKMTMRKLFHHGEKLSQGRKMRD